MNVEELAKDLQDKMKDITGEWITTVTAQHLAKEVQNLILKEKIKLIDESMNAYVSEEWRGLETLRNLKKALTEV